MDQKAVEAVRKWRFRAGTKDGAAVAVRVQVEVNFGLQLEPKMGGTGPLIFSATSGVMSPVLTHATRQLVEQVPPQYPAEASKAKIQGTVVLAIVIGADGGIKDIREIDGPPELIPAAVAAVKQWRYHPALFRGQPREASTEVEIQFKLPE